MLSRITINRLLKSVVAVLAAGVIVQLALGAWNSWTRFQSIDNIAAAANSSSLLFKGLHNLRVDRSTTSRDLTLDKQLSDLNPPTKAARVAEVPALKAAIASLENVRFPDKAALTAQFSQGFAKLTALHAETVTALQQPLAQRRASLSKEFFDTGTSLIGTIEKIQLALTKAGKLEDAFIDQLMEVKELAWIARSNAGDTAVLLANMIVGTPVAENLPKFKESMAKYEVAWAAMEDLASSLPMPKHFADVIARGREEFSGRAYTELRNKQIETLLAGKKPDVNVNEWSALSITKLAFLLNAAEGALEVAKEYAAEQRSAALWRFSIQAGLLILALLAAMGVLLMISRRVTGPLHAIQQTMLKLAAGEFNVTLPGLERKDEIGDVANAVERFKVLAVEKAQQQSEELVARQKADADKQAEAARLEAERASKAAQEEAERQKQAAEAEAASQAKIAAERAKIAEEQALAVGALGQGLQKLADGDLTFRLPDQFPEAYRQIKDDFNGAISRLQETIRTLVASTREVASAAAEISTSTTDLSQRTEEQASSLERTSSAMEQISSTVRANAANAKQANEFATATREVANRGGAVVSEAVGAMSRIEDSSGKIADIIGVIDEIARQTNLLALNAAVEAARAGDAGRGFAVVATEVRSLAQRSSQAAKDIKDLIVSSTSQVKDGVELVNRAGSSLTEIVASIEKVTTIVAEISTASAEQATGLDDITKSLGQMDEATQQNSALVEENAATAKTLEQQSRAMDEQVGMFRVDGGQTARQATMPAAAKPSAAPAVVQRRAVAGGRAQAVAAEDWQEF